MDLNRTCCLNIVRGGCTSVRRQRKSCGIYTRERKKRTALLPENAASPIEGSAQIILLNTGRFPGRRETDGKVMRCMAGGLHTGLSIRNNINLYFGLRTTFQTCMARAAWV